MDDKRQAERQVREEETLKKIWAFQSNQKSKSDTHEADWHASLDSLVSSSYGPHS